MKALTNPPTIEDYRELLVNHVKRLEEQRNCAINSSTKVSIVTVVYNAEATIERTLKSIACQNYENIEYIIIDAKSSDRTLEIIEKYKHIVTYLISEKDGGIYDAMNKGISLCSGELIGLLNADDFYEPDALHNLISYYTTHKGDVLHGNVNYVKNGEKLFTLKPPIHLSKASFTEMPINHPATFIKEKFMKKLVCTEQTIKLQLIGN
ncbi:hypothetical protein GCM10028895_05080 [Pontibacter rugosus]